MGKFALVLLVLLGIVLIPYARGAENESLKAETSIIDGDITPAVTPGPGAIKSDCIRAAFDYNYRSLFVAFAEEQAIVKIILKEDPSAGGKANQNLTADTLEIYLSNDNVEFEKVEFKYNAPDTDTIILDNITAKGRYWKVHTTCGPDTPYRFVISSVGTMAKFITSDMNRLALEVCAYPEPAKVVVRMDAGALSGIADGTKLQVLLYKPGSSAPIQRQESSISCASAIGEVIFDLQKIEAGKYVICASARTPEGKIIGEESKVPIVWAGQPKAFKDVKILNNLVWELLNVQEPQTGAFAKEYTFNNPQAGWVFIQTSAKPDADGKVYVMLDSETREQAASIHSQYQQDVLEVMNMLSAGQHKIRIKGEDKTNFSSLVVRRIPSLRYSVYDPTPKISPYGPYDRAFLWEDVLRNSNQIVDCHWDPNDLGFFKEWKRMGRRLFIYANLPPVKADQKYVEDYCFRFWTEREWMTGITMKDPLFDGIYVDEFTGHGQPFQFDVWRKGLEQTKADSRFKDKIIDGFYGWDGFGAGIPVNAEMKACMKTLIANGGTVWLERYLHELPNEAAAQRMLRAHFAGAIMSWKEHFPGAINRVGVALGIASFSDLTWNTDPSVNFKVSLEMQVQALATHPAYFGLGGIDIFHSNRCDEETVRWIGKLYRHYGIEGNTERLGKDPYMLTHLENPDFADGIKGWTVSPAEEESVTAKHMNGYGTLQGRWAGGLGDSFLWTKRSIVKPNRFSQVVKDLQPGKLYSMKMITADYENMVQGKSEQKTNRISIALENAEVFTEPRKNIHVTCGLRYYSGKNNLWSNEKLPYINYHWLVFRAKSETTTLTVSDWASEKDPGGPVGQEIMHNFIEIQPYMEK